MKIIRSRHKNFETDSRQTGVTMIEILIALAILSIGLAGIAIMHLNSLKYVHSSYERSLASSIALDLEERLWLAVADTSSVGCPTLSTEDGSVVDELVDHWTNTTRGTYGDKSILPASIPGLSIALKDTRTFGTPGSGPAFAEVDLELSWGNDVQRFNDNESTGQKFNYTARIYCSADYVTTIPTT